MLNKEVVDKHVQLIESGFKSSLEKQMLGLKIARMYYEIEEYTTALRYLSTYLSVKAGDAKAHKLMGDIYHVNNSITNAIDSYKKSLDLHNSQKELVLKVAKLYAKLEETDIDTLTCWVEKASTYFCGHKDLFELTEILLQRTGDRAKIKDLLYKELKEHPDDVCLHSRFIDIHCHEEMCDKAFDHCVEYNNISSLSLKPDWHRLVASVCDDYLNSSKLIDDEVRKTVILRKLLSLCCELQIDMSSRSTGHCSAILYRIDTTLMNAIVLYPIKRFSSTSEWETGLGEIRGQIYYGAAVLFFKHVLQGSMLFKEGLELMAICCVSCLQCPPHNISVSWVHESHFKSFGVAAIPTDWYALAGKRCSQTGHVLKEIQDLKGQQWLDEVQEIWACKAGQSKVFQQLYGLGRERNSSFLYADEWFNKKNVIIPSTMRLLEFDTISALAYGKSFDDIVWIGLHWYMPCDDDDSNSDTHTDCLEWIGKLFSKYQFCNAVDLASFPTSESLSLLDIQALVYASVRTCALLRKERHILSSVKNFSITPFKMLCKSLSQLQQSSLWNAMWNYTNSLEQESISAIRQTLNHGLSVLRVHGSSHGLSPSLLVHLGKTFAARCEEVSSANYSYDAESVREWEQVQQRACHYWNKAISILSKMDKFMTTSLLVPESSMFPHVGKDINRSDAPKVIHDGKLYLSSAFVRMKQDQLAITMLNELDTPEASYNLSQIFRKLATSKSETFSRDDHTIESSYKKIQDHLELLYHTRDYLDLASKRIGLRAHPLKSCVENELLNTNGIIDNLEHELDLLRNQNYENDDIGDSKQSQTNTQSHRSHACSLDPELIKQMQSTMYALSQNHMAIHDNIAENNVQIKQLNSYMAMMLHKLDEIRDGLLDRPPVTQIIHQAPVLPPVSTVERECQTTAEPSVNTDYQMPVTRDSVFGNGSRALPFNPQFENSGIRFDNCPAVGIPLPGHVVPPIIMSTPFVIAGQKSVIPKTSSIAMSSSAADFLSSTQSRETKEKFNLFGGNKLPEKTLPVFTVLGGAGVNGQAHAGLSFSEALGSERCVFGKPFNIKGFGQDIGENAQSSPSSATISNQWNCSHCIATNACTNSSCFACRMPKDGTFDITYAATLPAPKPFGSLGGITNSPDISFASTAKGPSIFSTIKPEGETNSFSDPGTQLFMAPSSDTSINDSRLTDDDGIHFTPIVELPDHVDLTTGEESEDVIFQHRAKLYRFDDSQWKERGLGNVKILQHKENDSFRVVMRRDQILKLCANHRITTELKLKKHPTADKSWIWTVTDFANGEGVPELLAIRFKSQEIADGFKEKFEECQQILRQSCSISSEVHDDSTDFATSNVCDVKETTPESATHNSSFKPGSSTTDVGQSPPTSSSDTSHTLANIFGIKQDDWNCSTCLCGNKASSVSCVACSTPNPNLTQPSSAELPVTSFKFTSECIDKPMTTSIFSFKTGATTPHANSTPIQSSGFSFGMSTKTPVFNDGSSLMPSNFNFGPNLNKNGSVFGTDLSFVPAISTPAIITAPIVASTFNFRPSGSSSFVSDFKSKIDNGGTFFGGAPGQKPVISFPAPVSMSCSSGTTATTSSLPFSIPSPKISVFARLGTSGDAPRLCTDVNVDECAEDTEDNDHLEYDTDDEYGDYDDDRDEYDDDGTESEEESNYDSNQYRSPIFRNVNSAVDLQQSDSDIMYIREIQPTQEQQKRAMQLMLPPAFFLYEQHPPCSGCPGCELDSDIETTFTLTTQQSHSVKEENVDIHTTSIIDGEDQPESSSFMFGNSSTSNLSFAALATSSGSDFKFNTSSARFSSQPLFSKSDLPDGEVEQNVDVHFEPIVKLPEVQIKSGEEEEEVMFLRHTKLYRFVKNEWKERGVGNIKILWHVELKRARILMRRDQIYKLCANHTISRDLEIQCMPGSDRAWIWAVTDYSETDGNFETLAARFKNAEIAREFQKQFQEAKSRVIAENVKE